MDFLASVVNYLLPLLGFIFLLIGIHKQKINFIVISLWFSLVTLFLQYQTAGGEILGSYFGYKNALFYSLNLMVLIVAFVYLCFKTSLLQQQYLRYISGAVAACLITGGLILITNLMINAGFIENKLPGTPVIQVVASPPPNYCPYKYVFYKVAPNRTISYLCPNFHGFLPAVGKLDAAPEFIVRQLAQQSKNTNG